MMKKRTHSSIFAACLFTTVVATTSLVSTDSFAAPEASERQELVHRINEAGSGNNYWQSYLFESLVSFDLPPDGWQAFLTDKGVSSATGIVSGLGYYAKEQKYADLWKIDSANNNDKKGNRPRVKAAVDGLKGKISFTLRGQGVKYDSAATALLLRYMNYMYSLFGRSGWTPKADSAAVIFVFSPTAKEVAVSITPDGKTFTITAPAYDEPNEWDSKIKKGMFRGAK